MGACDSDRNYYHDTQVKFDQFGENNFVQLNFTMSLFQLIQLKILIKVGKLNLVTDLKKTIKI